MQYGGLEPIPKDRLPSAQRLSMPPTDTPSVEATQASVVRKTLQKQALDDVETLELESWGMI
jgi:hypothetical protein